MSKRHADALAIQAGACNPSGVAISIVDACREFRTEFPNQGTAELCADPAIRLMVHQLAYLCGVAELDSSWTAYTAATMACRKANGEKL